MLGELSGSSLTIVVLSAVISAVSTQAISGREPAFHVPAYDFNSVFELPLYLVLGLLPGCCRCCTSGPFLRHTTALLPSSCPPG